MEKLINDATNSAKDILIKSGYTCVLCSQTEEYTSTERGVKPLIEFLESGKDFSGFSAADKTVGLGAAHLYALLGIKSVWANVMSRPAKELFERYNIAAFCENEVPFIVNRKGDGVCPIEAAVMGIASQEEALGVIYVTLENLRKNSLQ